jgi:hypothetical protein
MLGDDDLYSLRGGTVEQRLRWLREWSRGEITEMRELAYAIQRAVRRNDKAALETAVRAPQDRVRAFEAETRAISSPDGNE